ncbi:MAG: hypothetical protein IJS07_01240 [Bacteroidales bacterium]|nr:hypothetical protein [Bacteroidales bacterium]
MRITSLLAFATIAIAIQGCGKVYPLFHGSAPSSIKVEKVDLTNASALAVMPYSDGESTIQTKAGGEEYDDRLFIVDKDGKTTLASFSFKEDGASNNKIWKKIRETLTLVPNQIVPLTKDLILLSSVHPVYEYTDWAQDAWGFEESDAINRLLLALTGPYFLRTSDGALFKSPFDFWDDSGNSFNSFDSFLKFTPDKKHIVLCYSQDAQKYRGWKFGCSIDVIDENLMPWVITDKGNSFELKYPSEPLLETYLVCGFMLTKDNTIIPLSTQGQGTWSFDLGLKPLFIDYTQELINVLNGMTTYKTYVFDFKSDTYIILRKEHIEIDGQDKTGVAVYRIFLNNGKLDSSLELFMESDFQFDLQSTKITSTETGITILTNGNKLAADLINKTIFEEQFPSDFPQYWQSYDENGIAYEMTDNSIIKYNLNSKKKTETPIHWEQVDFGGFVTYYASYSNGVFSVSGKTRTAQSVTVLIDVETGDVTLTGFSEYSGSVIKSYYRLN